MEKEKLIKALRCVSTPNPQDRNCEDCPYNIKEPIDKDDPLVINSNLEDREYWESCDLDRIGLDAADYIEQIEEKLLTQAAELLSPKMMCVKCELTCGPYERNNMCADRVKNWLKENIE